MPPMLTIKADCSYLTELQWTTGDELTEPQVITQPAVEIDRGDARGCGMETRTAATMHQPTIPDLCTPIDSGRKIISFGRELTHSH